MLEPRRKRRLAPKTLGAKRRGKLGVQEFERNEPIVLRVVGEKHPGHAPAPNLALEAVGGSKRRLKVACQFGRLHLVRFSGVRRFRT
jgi:hypothetical protein